MLKSKRPNKSLNCLMYASCIELLSICFFAVPTHGITFVEVVKKGVDVMTSFFFVFGCSKILGGANHHR